MVAMRRDGAGHHDAGWRPIAVVASPALVEARLQLHHAAQIIVSAAISYLERQPDDSQTSLEWLPVHDALATQALPSPAGLRFALHPAALALVAIEGGAVRATLPLHGRTVREGEMWLAAELGRSGLDPGRLTRSKHYEIPGHAVARGARFGALPAALAMLGDTWHDAWLLTSEVAAREPAASPPRCWPHHFDLATLITLPAARDGVTRTIGVGLSPGDDSYPEPYLYVGPRPYPPSASLPPLVHGRWHTAGWMGAVRTLPELPSAANGEAQAESARRFVQEAVMACRALLAAG